MQSIERTSHSQMGVGGMGQGHESRVVESAAIGGEAQLRKPFSFDAEDREQISLPAAGSGRGRGRGRGRLIAHSAFGSDISEVSIGIQSIERSFQMEGGGVGRGHESRLVEFVAIRVGAGELQGDDQEFNNQDTSDMENFQFQDDCFPLTSTPTKSCDGCKVLQTTIEAMETKLAKLDETVAQVKRRLDHITKDKPSNASTWQSSEIFADMRLMPIKAAAFITGRPLTAYVQTVGS
jgi:hypothetical protein